jgi:hypothetical protein
MINQGSMNMNIGYMNKKCPICKGNVRHLFYSVCGKAYLGDNDIQCVDCDFIAVVDDDGDFVVVGRRAYKNETYIVSDKRENKTILRKLVSGILIPSHRHLDTIIDQYIENVSDESLDKLLLLV